jgi:hypothetical protein
LNKLRQVSLGTNFIATHLLGLNFQHLEATLVSVEEYITQLKSGLLSSEVQHYIIQTGLAKVLLTFLKEGYEYYLRFPV